MRGDVDDKLEVQTEKLEGHCYKHSLKAAMFGGQEGERPVFTDTFSDDSLGESTRSLLSPVYGNGRRLKEPELSEGSLSDDDETDNEKDYSLEFQRSHSTPKHKAKTSRSYTTPTSSSFSGPKKSVRSNRSNSRSNTEGRKANSSRTVENKGDCLSPWETWLVKKTAEDREKRKQKRLEKKKAREESEKEEQGREELLKAASERYGKWLESKKKLIAEERKLKQQQEQLEKEMKENMNRMTQEKAAVKYNNWLDEKKTKENEKRRKEEEDARIKKDKQVTRKLNNEEAYSKWIAEVKERPKPVYNSFGYTGGMLTGYYEWGSYPAPSYCNPIPWMPPKVKRNSDRIKGKVEMQPASPPLLFRDIDNRKAKEKKK